ncbi:MAG: hypothetical protein JXR77_15245 [Lentisphaeria bacterium]|nr:hypothetical protein [Lentisphaeria bacterium]
MGAVSDRRAFLEGALAVAAAAVLPTGCTTSRRAVSFVRTPRPGKAAVVRGAFFYPDAATVLAGECEDGWRGQKWFTWPGNQYEPEQQHARFRGELRRLAADLDLELTLEEKPLSTDAEIRAFADSVATTQPDGLILVNFWNSFSGKIKPILAEFPGPIILYHPVGSNHQLPPQLFRTAPHTQYIHSIENWDALGQGLRAIHAKNRLGQSRLLRVSGRLQKEADAEEKFFGMPIHGVPVAHFNTLFDEVAVTPEMEDLAMRVRRRARGVVDLEREAFLDAVRAHVAVQKLLERHDADAITVECLFLKHRKPCLSFALNNGSLVPCGCENDLNASLSLMLGAALFGRGGFQHNPDFDTERNLYYASHCTCATRLHGPDGTDTPYLLRPFFHQMPKSLALDVQWPAGEPATLFKYQTEKKQISAWSGTVVESPTCPPAGGCATRVLVRITDVADVCTVYAGPHPILYCGDFARQAKVFAQLYEIPVETNA